MASMVKHTLDHAALRLLLLFSCISMHDCHQEA